jgi:hypothetical protein
VSSPLPAEDTPGLPEEEVQQRVIYSLLGPCVALAAEFDVPLEELVGWVRVAYFQHLRDRGLTLREASDKLGVSTRTSKRLSQALKVSFLRPEIEHNLPVRIEFMLRAQPMSAARMAQVIHDVSPERVHAALDQLVAEERIVPQRGRTTTYAVVRSVNSLVRDDWLARIGGLNSLLGNVKDTVLGRFFRRDAASMARTLSFRLAREGGLDALQVAFGTFVERIALLEQEAGEDAEPFRLSVVLAPYDED